MQSLNNSLNPSNLSIGFDEARYYLAAMIDGEGSVEYRPPSRRVTVYNTEEDIIDATIECLNILDIEYSIYEYKTGTYKNVTNIRITRRNNLEKLYELVPIQSKRKKKLLYDCISTYRLNLYGHNGIDFNRGKYRARKNKNGKRYHLGSFDSKIEAIEALERFNAET